MKIVFLTGNHPRHAFIARQLAETGYLESIVQEQRENFLPNPPERLDTKTRDLFVHHYKERDRVEAEMFGAPVFPDCFTHKTTMVDLNGKAVHKLLEDTQPDLLLSYGCHMLTQETLSCAKGEKWNCHGGLSPWYRGSITHFWPSYMLEPQMTGMTVHALTPELDAGDVVHQCAADLVRDDTLHMLAARAVLKLGEELPKLINLLKEKGSLKKKAHATSGMLWPSSKWRPEHLHQIYTHYNDRVVDAYLDGSITGKAPKLYRQFD